MTNVIVKKQTHRNTLLWVALFVIVFALSFSIMRYTSNSSTVSGRSPNSDTTQLPKFSSASLSQFNGTDPAKPIYIGLDGYVYDVSSGKDYYQEGGTYHFLTGRDSTKELTFIGGDIIKRKYPIVGIIE